MTTIFCPNCESDDILYSAKHQQYQCEDCDHKWQETTANESDYCRDLANNESWQNIVIEEWPAPIAHEYQRLHTLLHQGNFIPSMLQLKDLAEILIKFHTVCMYQWIKTYKTEINLNDINPNLFSTLSMGAWYNFSGQLAKLIIDNDNESDDSLGLYLANYFYNPKRTKINALLSELVQWRNQEIGHGAFRLNTEELWQDFGKYLQRLHECIAENNPWQYHRLVIDNLEEPIALIGSDSIRTYHDNLSPVENKQHILSANTLYCTQKTNDKNQLLLSPLIQAYTCSVCDLQDVFVFDSHDIYGGRFYYLDYLAGHRLKLHKHQSPLLNQSYHQANLVDFDEKNSTINKQALNANLVDLLKEKSLEANYISPKYLQKPLANFINTHNKGLFWLTAPAHIGKSIFVHGIANNLDNKPMLDDLIVVRFHIRREFRYFSHHMIESFGEQLKQKFNLTSGTQQLPQIDTNQGNKAFINWLNEWWQISPYRHDHKLLVAIDGLDEIGKRQASDNQQVVNILDLLPTNEELKQLDDNIYLLLTSRPVEDCPSWMQTQLNQQFIDTQSAEFTEQLNIDLQYAEYQSLLKKYMDNKLNQQFADIKDNTLRQAQGKKLFNTLLQKSEQRFLYFSLLVDIIKEQNLNLAQLQELPIGADLYEHFLNNLQQQLGGKDSKHFIQIKQLLTLLTACEQASVMDAQIMQESASNENTVSSGVQDIGQIVWNGLDLATIAGLLNESAGQHSTQLIFTLYTLKSLLSVERSETQAQYRLGLKELASYINDKWADEVLDWHRQLSEPFYYAWADRWDTLNMEVAENYYQARYLLAHINVLRGKQVNNIFEVVVKNDKLILFYEKQFKKYDDEVHYETAVEWISLDCYLIKQQVLIDIRLALIDNERNYLTFNSVNINMNLANSYYNRGILYYKLNNPQFAFLDYQQAINIIQGLQHVLGCNFPNEWQNNLALVYASRGNLYTNLNESQLALIDYQESIKIIRNLQQKLGNNFPYEWQNNLARVYVSRGVLYTELNKLELTLDDYKQVINIRENLKQQLGQSFPHQWQNDLAMVYMRRGIVYKDLNQLQFALDDCHKCIDIMKNMKQQLENHILKKWQNDLANAYINRGIVYKELNKLQYALEDYKNAIKISQKLQQQLGNNFPNQWQNNLANAYIYRGIVYKDLSELQLALVDYQKSIKLIQNLQQRLGDNFPNKWQNSLADVCALCGILYCDLNKILYALDSLQQAITIREKLQQKLGDNFPNQWKNNLANDYINRGLLYQQSLNEPQLALKDDQNAINIRQELQQQLGSNFPNQWKNDLANAYINRGNLCSNINEPQLALKDYQKSIEIKGDLQQQLGDNFPNQWKNNLAKTYINRGDLYQKSLNEPQLALEDYQNAIDIWQNLQQLLGNDFPHYWKNDLARAWWNKLILYNNFNDINNVEKCFKKVIQLNYELVILKQQCYLLGLIAVLDVQVKVMDNKEVILSTKQIITEIEQLYPNSVLTKQEKQALNELKSKVSKSTKGKYSKF